MSASQGSAEESPTRPLVTFALSGRGWLVSSLLFIDALIAAGLVLGKLNEANLIRALIAGQRVSDAELDKSDNLIEQLANAHGLVFVLAAIAFLIWIYSANARAHRLGREGMRFSPRASVLWFFAPFANLVVPLRAVREIWRASDPAVDSSDPLAWKRAPGSWILVVWWIAWIGANVLSRTLPTRLTGNESLQRLVDISTTAGWFSGGLLLSALLACAVVVLIESRLSASEKLGLHRRWVAQESGTYVGPDGELYRSRTDPRGGMVVERRSMDGTWSYAPASAIQGLKRVSD